MNEREQILGRIREALRVPAPRPGQGNHGPTPAQHRSTDPREFLPPAASGLEERLKMFQAKAVELKAEFRLVSTPQEMGEVLCKLRDSEQWRKIGIHKGELTDLAGDALNVPVCRTDTGYDVHELEKCSAGISECDALVAQTGSILVTARSAGGRALSVLPPHHVLLARRSQLVGDLPEAFSLLKAKYGKNYPSFISFITGPSRTGDIERILVLGAHGPKKLTIVCL